MDINNIIEQIKPIDRQKQRKHKTDLTILSNRSVHLQNWKLWFRVTPVLSAVLIKNLFNILKSFVFVEC